MTRRLKKFIGLFLPVLMLMTIMAGTAPAALLDFGPPVPEVIGSTPPNIKSGFPLWFRDSNRVPLQLCLEEVPGCLFAAVDRPNLGQPLAFPNIPDELFYYSATALIPNANAQLNDHLLFAGVEMNFADNGDGTYEQVGFARIRIRIDSTVAGNYTVTTPWKQFFFTVDQATINANAGRRVINATEDIGLGPDGVFDGVLLGSIGTFAYSQGAPFGIAPNLFLGDNTPRTLVGSPFTDPVTGQPANIFRIQGPSGFTTVSTDQFAVTGKIYNIDPIPTPLAVDKLTYARDSAGVQVSAFATTQAMSNQVNSGLAFPLNYALTNAPSTLQLTGTGLPTPFLTTNTPGDGKFFTNIGAFALGTIPANATITNTADTPVTVKTVPLVDEIKITDATFNPLNNTLTVAAQSLDTLGNRTLSVYISGNNTALGTITNGQFSATAPFVAGATSYAIPPNAITVKSDIGGEATAPVVAFQTVVAPVTAVTLSSDKASPQAVNTSVVFTAAATGGAAPVQYQFWTYNPATSTWTMQQDYSAANTWTWNTPTQGGFQIRVVARSAGSAAAFEAFAETGYFISNPVSNATLLPSVASPATAGTSVVFTASATGGIAPLQYQFWTYNPATSTWTMQQDYSAANTWTWNTPTPGGFQVRVHAKSAGSTAPFETFAELGYFVTVVTPVTSVSLTPSVASPAASGTLVVFTAAATGGTAPVQYQFWTYNPATATWTMQQDYSAVNNWVWNTPTQGGFQVRVHAKSAGSAETFETFKETGYIIQ